MRRSASMTIFELVELANENSIPEMRRFREMNQAIKQTKMISKLILCKSATRGSLKGKSKARNDSIIGDAYSPEQDNHIMTVGTSSGDV